MSGRLSDIFAESQSGLTGDYEKLAKESLPAILLSNRSLLKIAAALREERIDNRQDWFAFGQETVKRDLEHATKRLSNADALELFKLGQELIARMPDAHYSRAFRSNQAAPADETSEQLRLVASLGLPKFKRYLALSTKAHAHLTTGIDESRKLTASEISAVRGEHQQLVTERLAQSPAVVRFLMEDRPRRLLVQLVADSGDF